MSPTKPFDYDKAWQDHLDRLRKIDNVYPSRYPLYLVYHRHPLPGCTKGGNNSAKDPLSSWLDHLDRMAALDKLYPEIYPSHRRRSPTPVKPTMLNPRPSEVAYNYAGNL